MWGTWSKWLPLLLLLLLLLLPVATMTTMTDGNQVAEKIKEDREERRLLFAVCRTAAKPTVESGALALKVLGTLHCKCEAVHKDNKK